MTQFANKTFSVSMMANGSEPTCKICGKPYTTGVNIQGDGKYCIECYEKEHGKLPKAGWVE
jgi:recombinational DNA repair protein (RecF pathway)